VGKGASIISNKKNVRVAVFNTHPIQYYAPLWRRLAAFDDLDVTVYYGSDFSVRGYLDQEFKTNIVWDVPLLEGYDSRFLQGYEKVNEYSFFNPSPGPAIQCLLSERPDVVVLCAYHSAFWYGIAAASIITGAKVVMRHDASDEAYGSKGLRRTLRWVILRMLYRWVSRFAVVGERARRHLTKFGVSDLRMSWSPFCVDSCWVESLKKKWCSRRLEIRKSLGIGEGDTAILFCGKLIEKKDPLLLVESIRLLYDKSRIHLVMAGSGILEAQVETTARSALGDRFHPLGFLNQSEIGRAYAAGDIFVLPSRNQETWGLVVNEALQFGLPVVISDAVGCHEDLVSDESTGRVFRAGDVFDLSAALKSILSEFPAARSRYDEVCRDRAARYSLELAASGLRSAILQT